MGILKKSLLILTVVFLLTTALLYSADQKLYKVQIKSIPKTIDEFISMRDDIAKIPEGGIAMLLVALKMYENNQEEGIKALILATDLSLLRKGENKQSYKGYFLGGYYPEMLNSVFNRYPYIASSYFPGTKPADGYKMGPGPYDFSFTLHKHRPQDDKEHTLFVSCSGADYPRPVQVKKNDKGLWKAANYSSILMGIRAAEKPEPVDDL